MLCEYIVKQNLWENRVVDVDNAYSGFLKDSIRFLMAQNYFLHAANAGLKGDTEIAERHKAFDADVKPEYKDSYTYVSAQLFGSMYLTNPLTASRRWTNT